MHTLTRRLTTPIAPLLVTLLSACPAPRTHTQPRATQGAVDNAADPRATAAHTPRLVEIRDGFGGFYLRWTLPGEAVRMSDPEHDSGEQFDLYCPYDQGSVLRCERRANDILINGRVAGVDLRVAHAPSRKRIGVLGKAAQVLLWERAKKIDRALLKAIAEAPDVRLLSLLRFGSYEATENVALEIVRHKVRGLVVGNYSQVKPSHLAGFQRLRTLHMSWANSPTTISDLSTLPALEVLRLGYLRTARLGDLTPLVLLRRLRVLRLENARVHSATLDRLAHLPQLAALQLKKCFLGSAALRRLGRLKGLRLLDLQANNVSTGALAHLVGLRHLKVLNIGWVGLSSTSFSAQHWSGYTDDSVAMVARMKQLEGLSLAVNKRTTNKGLAHLRSLTRLRDLDLLATRVNDAGLVHLAPLTRLRRLNLAATGVRGPGLRHLAPLVRLEVLNARGLAPGGLRHLPPLPRLRSLTISRGKLRAAELAHLKKQRRLERLRVAVKKLDGSGLTHLRGVGLKYLAILRTEVTASGLEAISHLTGLRTLILYSYKGPPAKLAVLSRLVNLERLVLSGDFSDDALRHLAGLRRLRSLTLSSWKVQGSGISHLKPLQQLRQLNLGFCKGGSTAPAAVMQLRGLRDFTPPRRGGSYLKTAVRESRPDILVRSRY